MNARCDVHEILYGARASANALCTNNPGDKYWCEFARARGYDSIQIKRGTATTPTMKRKPWSELIMCAGECERETFSESACVPIARAITAAGEVRPCDCPAGAETLSCDGIDRNQRDYPGQKVSVLTALPLRIAGERAPPQNIRHCMGIAEFLLPPHNKTAARAQQRTNGTHQGPQAIRER